MLTGVDYIRIPQLTHVLLACSSGCGFHRDFAKALGYTPAQFGELAPDRKAPVDLGSRCPVFMEFTR